MCRQILVKSPHMKCHENQFSGCRYFICKTDTANPIFTFQPLCESALTSFVDGNRPARHVTS